MSRGILYLASGSSYVEEAKTSARTLKQQNPSLSVTLYTDTETSSGVFDQVLPLGDSIDSMGDSILSGKYVPYDSNLYLDTDTYVCGDLTDVFELLDRFDLAASQNPGGVYWNETFYEQNDMQLPGSFAEYNTGVIAYNDCSDVRDFFETWNRIYHSMDLSSRSWKTNQPAFRHALYESNIRFVTLQPEYNFQLNNHRYARGEIKVLHNSGRYDIDLENYATEINSFREGRIITWEEYPFRMIPARKKSNTYRVKQFLSNRRLQRRLFDQAREKWNKDGSVSFVKSALKKPLAFFIG